MIHEKNTNDIEKMLEGMKPAKLDEFYKENEKYMADESKAFYYYMKDIMESKHCLFKDMYIRADVSQSYGEKIIRMEKHTKNRDLIIRLCLAGHFSVLEMNRALKLYGMNPLYAKDKRDACIIVAINNRIYQIWDVDDLLQKQGFAKLLME